MVRPASLLPSALRLAGALAMLCAASAPEAIAQATPAVASVRGTATDSLRGGTLAGGFVELSPSGRQVAIGADGRFRFDSVAPRSGYRLRVMHALLDTVGIALVTPTFEVAAGEAKVIDVAVPSATSLVALLCPAAWVAQGAGALVGFVRDPDSGAPIDSVIVSLVYDWSPLRQATLPVTRVTRPDSLGHYVLCGLPATMQGRVQLDRNGVRSADIAVSISERMPLTVRALGMSRAAPPVTAGDSLALGAAILTGPAMVKGRVLTAAGEPIAEARVQMDGTGAVSLTNAAGEFTLDSVPIGTQVISARKLGYAVAEATVEVSRYDTPPVSVRMAEFIPTLPTVVTRSQRETDMETTGFARRKAQGLGFFLEGDQIDRGPPSLGEALRMVPGIRIGYDAQNRTAQRTMIMGSRDPRACLRFVVDGVYWQEIGGDIEKFVRPYEIEALEMFTPATVPGEFASVSRGRCSVLVLWTRHKIRPAPPPR